MSQVYYDTELRIKTSHLIPRSLSSLPPGTFLKVVRMCDTRSSSLTRALCFAPWPNLFLLGCFSHCSPSKFIQVYSTYNWRMKHLLEAQCLYLWNLMGSSWKNLKVVENLHFSYMPFDSTWFIIRIFKVIFRKGFTIRNIFPMTLFITNNGVIWSSIQNAIVSYKTSLQ